MILWSSHFIPIGKATLSMPPAHLSESHFLVEEVLMLTDKILQWHRTVMACHF
jgi:hypothetical protein